MAKMKAVGRKIRKALCPFCRDKDEVIPILYGFPSTEGFKRAERGEVYIGGYEVGPNRFFCRRDNKEF